MRVQMASGGMALPLESGASLRLNKYWGDVVAAVSLAALAGMTMPKAAADGSAGGASGAEVLYW